MNLDEIKRKAQEVRAPETGTAGQLRASRSSETLTAMLRAQDERERTGLRKALPLFAIAAALWFLKDGLTLILIVTGLLPQRPAQAVDDPIRLTLGAVFLFITISILRRSRQMAEIDYGVPMREFLVAAEKRYRFLRPADYLTIVLGCVLLGTVAGVYVVALMTRRYFGPEYRTMITGLYCVLYLGGCVMGLWFTYRNWQRDKKLLWLEIRETLAEVNAEEPDPANA